MRTITVKISIGTAKKWYNGYNEELKGLALIAFPELKNKLPKTWEELKNLDGWYVAGSNVYNITTTTAKYNNKNVFKTKAQAEASIATAQLSQVIAEYNGGWVADWGDENQAKLTILFTKEEIIIVCSYTDQRFLAFKDVITARLFLKNYEDLIIQAKPLL